MNKIRPRHKYGAIRDTSDGINFDSKVERRYYEKLKLLQKSGELVMFLRQPLFDIPGNPKTVPYRADFLEFWADGSVRVVDVKGVETEAFKVKKRIVEALYPVTIEVVKE